MCYFPKCVVIQGNNLVKGSNIDICKLESRIGVQHFLFRAFKKKLCCDLVLCGVGRCDAIFSFIGATNIC